MGILGGLSGALFNALNCAIARLRMRLMQRMSSLLVSRVMRVAEVIIVVTITTIVVYCLPLAFECLPNPSCTYDDEGEGDMLEHDYLSWLSALFLSPLSATSSDPSPPSPPSDICCAQPSLPLKQFTCPKGYYSPMATLSFAPLDVSVQHLFHSCQTIPLSVLLTFGVVTFFLGCITYGINIPSGVFVPCVLTGAGMILFSLGEK